MRITRRRPSVSQYDDSMSDAGARSGPAPSATQPTPKEPRPALEVPSRIGPHELSLTGSILHIRFAGPYLPDEARQVLSLADQLYRIYGGAYLLADVSRNPPPPPETRRTIAKWPYLGAYVAALYGATAAVRVITTLMISAQRLLRANQPIITELFNTEAEARAWLAEQRQRLQCPAGKPTPDTGTGLR